MTITWTAIGLLVVQSFMPSSPEKKDFTYIKYDEIQAIQTENYAKGGLVKFYLEGNASDSLGLVPIEINLYTEEAMNEFVMELTDKLKNLK
tara:strand:- start:1191 stop:1463 length:273 start_codon:yes stop_codon:yes gene_type:complete